MAQGTRKAIVRVLKLLVAAIVLAAVGRHVVHVFREIRGRGESIAFAPEWLAGAGGLYLLGLAACGRFYERVVKTSGGALGFAPALRAYLVSHLGKYVPGKAMVVVVRVALSTPFDVRAATAAAATFYETLVMMAAGGLIAAACFVCVPSTASLGKALSAWNTLNVPVNLVLALLGLGLGSAFLVLTAPPVFGRIAGKAGRLLANAGADTMPRLSWPLLAEGLLLSTLGWGLLGLSQLAVIASLRGLDGEATLSLALAALAIGGVAFATVAGFVVAVLPGGLGLREGVLMSLLTPAIGAERSVVAALVLRLVWVAAELAAALISLPWLRPQNASDSSLSDTKPGTP